MKIKGRTSPVALARYLRIARFTPLLFFAFTVKNAQSQAIPANFFGINYWMPSNYITSGEPDPAGIVESAGLQALMEDAGSKIYRIGGNGYDESGIAIGATLTTNDYLAAIDAVLDENPSAKFLVQIPVEAGITAPLEMSPTLAGNLVDNIEAAHPSLDFYYSIGNEWDLYDAPGSPAKYTVAQMKTLIQSYALEMKRADPDIKIVAPATTFLGALDENGVRIIQQLLGGTADIGGLITGSGDVLLDGIKYYIDVVDYHSYAGGSSFGDMSGLNSGNYSTHRSASVAFPTGNFTAELSSASNNLQSILDDCNTDNSRTGANKLKFAITEMNIDYINPPLSSATATSEFENTTLGLGPRSFFAGQYWVDMFGAMLKIGTDPTENQIEFVMPWSIHEHDGDGMSDGTGKDLSMTKGDGSLATPTPLSTYWHYQMMAQNFAGNYLPEGSASTTLLKAFAYENTAAQEMGVLVINQTEQAAPRGYDTNTNSFSIGFGSATPTGPAEEKFTFSAGTGISQFDCTMPKESSMLVVFSTNSGTLGNIVKKEIYSLSHSQQDEAPSPVMTGTLSITTQSALNSNAPGVYTTISFSPGSPISVGTLTVNNDFRFTSDATVNGEFTVPSGETFSLTPTPVCQ